jgi:signal transduction histidine kinase
MPTPLGWAVVLLSLLAGVGAVGLLVALWPYREKPGAAWLLVGIGGQIVWSVAYAVALLVFDPTVRWILAVVVWLALVLTGITFLGFALLYTGRARLLETWWSRLFVASAAVVGALVLTNQFHGLIWRSFDSTPVGGLSTVTYDFGPVAYLGVGGGSLGVLTGSLLLFETVASYGRLYRSEAIAVGVSTVPPVAGLLAWLFQVGPVPALNLTTVLFVPHVALDLYAFVGSDMFEFHPATRRAGERAAIDDLGIPVFIIDEEHRVVTLNEAATSDFGLDKRSVLTRPVDGVLPGDAVDPAAGEQAVTLWPDGRRRGFRVTPSPLRDGRGTLLGYTLLCQDVTRRRQREQRLEVLNRILRHNLRNDLNVVRGFVDEAGRRTGDDEVESMLDRASGTAAGLSAVGEKARVIERALAADRSDREAVDLAAVARHAAAAAESTHPDAAVTVEFSAPCTVETNPHLLESVLTEVLENGIVHDPTDVPTVRIRPAIPAEAPHDREQVGIAVVDDGPGIPDHELAVLEEGDETELEHGSGLGLWLVHWGVRALGGTVAFDVDDDGTTVTVLLPG